MNQIMKRNGKRNKVKNRKYDYAAMITMAVLLLMPMNAFAAAQVQGKINNLYSIVTTIITAAGAIVLAWGVFEFVCIRLSVQRYRPADGFSEEGSSRDPDVPGAYDHKSSEVR